MRAQEFAWITTQGGSVQIVDPSTNTVTKTLQLPGVAAPFSATDIALSPAGNKVYVTTDSPSGTFVIDANTGNVRSTIPVAGYSVTVSRDGTRAYVGSKASPIAACPSGGFAISVAIIDVATDTLLTSPSGLQCIAANRLALSQDGTQLYMVGNPLFSGQALAIYDLTRNVFISSSANIQPWGIGITQDGTHAYLTGYVPLGSATAGILEIETSTDSVTSTLQLPAGSFTPSDVAMSGDGTRAYVLDLERGPQGSLVQVIRVIDIVTNTASTLTELSAFGYGTIALNHDGSRLYVTRNDLASSSRGSISVIDTATGNVIASISSEVNTEPTSVAIVPSGTGITTDFTDRGAFNAATINQKTIGFAGILPPGVTFGGYGQLEVPGASFTAPLAGTFVNVTTANFYSPNTYPADFIVDSVNQNTGLPNANNQLAVSLTNPTFALGLDIGGLGFSGASSGTITLSNGHVFNLPVLPTVGHTLFVGFISTVPITGLTLSTTNDSFVVEDVITATPVIANCSLSIVPGEEQFGPLGGAGSFQVDIGANCSWGAVFNEPWIVPPIQPIAIVSGSPPRNTGPGSVRFWISSNESTTARKGTISVGSQEFQVDQASVSCSPSITPNNQFLDASGGIMRVVIRDGQGCAWNATSNASWLAITSAASGTGTGSIAIQASPNSGAARTGTMTIAGQALTVQESAPALTACGASDVTLSASISPGPLNAEPFPLQYTEDFRITNGSGSVLRAPLWLVFVGVPNNRPAPFNTGFIHPADRQTTCFDPNGSGAFLISGDLSPGQSVTITPEFFVDSGATLSYTLKLLSGPLSR
jgi:YVTN family beta-propeller protein